MRAKREGVRVVGSIHSHPYGPTGPSDLDLAIAKKLGTNELRAVWHPGSGSLTFYGRSGVLLRQVVGPSGIVDVGRQSWHPPAMTPERRARKKQAMRERERVLLRRLVEDLR